jgi:hypothetical protein
LSRGDNQTITTPAPDSPAPAAGDRADRLGLRLARALVPAENPAGTVYGTLAIGALLAAESGLHESYLDTFLSALVAACGYWLLHAYTHVLGERLAGSERLTASVLWRALAHDRTMLYGAAVPLSVILLCWITGAGRETAVTAALWSAIATMIAFELLAGLRARSSAAELSLEVGVGVALGAAVLAVRVLLH